MHKDRLTIYVEFDKRSMTCSWHAVQLTDAGGSELYDDDSSSSSKAPSDVSASLSAWLWERTAGR